MSSPSEAAIAGDEASRDQGLVRAIGTAGLALAIVNGVVGGGIFVLPASLADAVGPAAPLAYLLCAVAMGAVVICFAEAGSRVPTSGGSYGYVEAAFGSRAGFVTGMSVWLSSALACGGIAAALAAAIAALVPALGNSGGRAVVIVAAVGGIAFVNALGVRSGARLTSIATIVKLIPLGVLLLLGTATIDWSALPPPTVALGEADIGRAVILALFAFSGMETVLASSGEVKRPSRTVPRATMLGMGFVLVLYIGLQLVTQGLLGDALARSATPLADAIAVIDPRLRILLLVGTALSLLGWIASDIIGAPRVLFAFGRDGLLPAALGQLDPRSRAPVIAIVVHSLVVLALALSGTFVQLAILSSLSTAIIYFAACAAAWALHRRDIAVLGDPLSFRILPLAALAGMACMIAIVALASPSEMLALAGLVAGSIAIHAVATRRRAA
ncbi:APC family permease [Sphingomonas sp. 1P06PA]|uniref:APC family permease n=1 Tax=Sphingomonas sp. 1P06PA TaxID=554121 RepID=UPI0039A4DDED